MATRNYRGSEEYTPPEILHAQPGVPTYWTSADVWGIGLILYELFTGYRVFNSRSEAFQQPLRIPQVYLIKHIPCTFPEMASANANQVLSAPVSLDEIGSNQLEDFAGAVNAMNLTNVKFEGNPTIQSRLNEINVLLKAILQRDPAKRFPIDVLEHHFGAYYIRSRLEKDIVRFLFDKY